MRSFADPFDPARAAAFKEAGYQILPGLLGPEMVEYFWSYAQTKLSSLQMVPADSFVPNAPESYGDPALDGLLEFVRPRIAAAAGARLLPTYSFMRIYRRGDVLPRHRDRPACEVSVSINMGQDPEAPWPIFIEGPRGAAPVSLTPGDAVLYRGMDCMHWREAYGGERLVQVFLHYVDADGAHTAERYDRRPGLMRPKRGAEARSL